MARKLSQSDRPATSVAEKEGSRESQAVKIVEHGIPIKNQLMVWVPDGHGKEQKHFAPGLIPDAIAFVAGLLPRRRVVHM